MKIINLRLHYPHCQQDKLVEVSEEVFDVLCQSVREGSNSGREKLHINLHILREYHPGHEKSRQLRRRGHPLVTLTRSYRKVSGSSRSS